MSARRAEPSLHSPQWAPGAAAVALRFARPELLPPLSLPIGQAATSCVALLGLCHLLAIDLEGGQAQDRQAEHLQRANSLLWRLRRPPPPLTVRPQHD